ncbi:MAG: hypothetical protein E2P02_24390 [Acidobacteria bacterium]|nr:MAG: hypothetical protein E2P02_24390 [Acidobacteriota bacterium]
MMGHHTRPPTGLTFHRAVVISSTYRRVRLSPDGRLLAFGISGANGNIWIYDLAQDVSSALTADFDNSFPVWTPDGKHLTFSSTRAGSYNLYEQSIDGGAPAKSLSKSEYTQAPGAWIPDGTALLFSMFVETQWDPGRGNSTQVESERPRDLLP